MINLDLNERSSTRAPPSSQRDRLLAELRTAVNDIRFIREAA